MPNISTYTLTTIYMELNRNQQLHPDCDPATKIEYAHAMSFLKGLFREEMTQEKQAALIRFFRVRPPQFAQLDSSIKGIYYALLHDDARSYPKDSFVLDPHRMKPAPTTEEKLIQESLYSIYSDMAPPTQANIKNKSWFSSLFSKPVVRQDDDTPLVPMDSVSNYYEMALNVSTAVTKLSERFSNVKDLCFHADKDGYEPLHYAAMNEETGLINQLIALGANINVQTTVLQDTPLTLAVLHKRTLSFHELITKPNINIEHKRTDNKNAEMIAKEVGARNGTFSPLCYFEFNALGKAVFSANSESVKKILAEKGGEEVANDIIPGYDALKIALELRNHNLRTTWNGVIMTLLEYSKFNDQKYWFHKFSDGKFYSISAAEMVLHFDHLDAFKKQVELDRSTYIDCEVKGCKNCDKTSTKNSIILSDVLAKGALKIANWMLDENLQGLVRSGGIGSGYSPLFRAVCFLGDVDITRRLIEKGANVSHLHFNSKSLLHVLADARFAGLKCLKMAESKQIEMIKLVLSHIDLKLLKHKDFDNLTVLEHAVKNKRTLLIELLVQHPGVDLSEKHNGKSLEEVAIANKWTKITALLEAKKVHHDAASNAPLLMSSTMSQSNVAHGNAIKNSQ